MSAEGDAYELFRMFYDDDMAGVFRVVAAAAGTDRAAATHNAAMRWAIEKGRPGVVRHLLIWEGSGADPGYDENEPLRTAVACANLEAARLLVEDGRVDMEEAVGHILSEGELNYQSQGDYDRAVQTIAHLFEHCPGQDAVYYQDSDTHAILLCEYPWARWSMREAFSQAALLAGVWRLRDEDFGSGRSFCRYPDSKPIERYDVLGVAVFTMYPGIARIALDHAVAVGKFDADEAARAWYCGAHYHSHKFGWARTENCRYEEMRVPCDIRRTQQGAVFFGAARATLDALATNAQFLGALARKRAENPRLSEGPQSAWICQIVDGHLG